MKNNKYKNGKKDGYELDKWDVILSYMVVVSLIIAIIVGIFIL